MLQNRLGLLSSKAMQKTASQVERPMQPVANKENVSLQRSGEVDQQVQLLERQIEQGLFDFAAVEQLIRYYKVRILMLEGRAVLQVQQAAAGEVPGQVPGLRRQPQGAQDARAAAPQGPQAAAREGGQENGVRKTESRRRRTLKN